MADFDPTSLGAVAVEDFDPASLGAVPVEHFDPASIGAVPIDTHHSYTPTADDAALVNQAAREGKPVIMVDGKPTLGDAPKNAPLSTGDKFVQAAESSLGTTALKATAGAARLAGQDETADSLSKDATTWKQQQPTDVTSKIGSGAGSAVSLMASGGLPGALTNIGLQSQAEKLSFSAALKSVPELAAYWLLGMGAGKAVGPLLEQASPAVKALASGAAATTANIAASAAIRKVNGESAVPDAESLAQDALFGFGAHGISEGKKAVTDQAAVKSMLESAPDDALKMAAEDPDFRKSAPYDPKLIDDEIARREQAPKTVTLEDPSAAPKTESDVESVTPPAATKTAPAITNVASPESPTETPAGELKPTSPFVQNEATVSSEPKAEDTAIAKDWTSATESDESTPTEMKRAGGEAGNVTIPKFADRKMSELDRATTGRSAKLQKSFDEATRAQHEIADIAPSAKRQSAISVWMEANGDDATLKGWEAGAKEKVFREAARDAQALKPEEIALAQKAKATFDVLAQRGQKFEVLKSARDNYVPHVWEVKKGEETSSFGSKALQEKFKFSKARTFGNFAEGDAAGFKPKTLEIGKLLPAYMHEMNKVIADRQFVQDLSNGKAKDSRPLVVPRGRVSEIETEHGGKAFLANPDAMKGLKDAAGNPVDTVDYRTMENQPALHEWKWEAKDENGNPIYMRDDLALHPEAAKRLEAMVGKSWLKTKLAEPSEGASAVGKAIIRGIDTAQSVMKREMFGLLAPFHQVQEGTHAIAHRVNPFFGIEPVDMRQPKFMDAAQHGLMMLPDRATSAGYMEGIGGKGSFLTQALRWFGGKNEGGIAGKAATAMANVVDGYQNYLFHQYIPSLKFKTYEKVTARNAEVYAKELKSGELTPADVKLLSAEQTNAAYGHLNRDLLDRSATQQHIMQLTLLAPDFLEARGRFVAQAAKGLLGSKVGEEQFKALAFMALVQAGAALTITSLAGGKYDPKKPFSVIIGGREYTMRSVPEDLLRFGSDVTAFAKGGDRGMPFVSARINPLLQSLSQYLSGINYRGEKVSSLDTTEELLAKYIPITARSAPGIRSLTETSRQAPISPLEQLAGSLGLKISRHSPINDTYANASEWMEKNKVPRSNGSYPISKFQQLRYALEDGDMENAQKEMDKLKTGSTQQKILSGLKMSVDHPFTKNAAMDKQFRQSLSESNREVFDLAQTKRAQILSRAKMLH